MIQSLAILITYYNEKELLTACLESLRVQTVMPDEIMVYDDCSTFPAVDYLPNNFPLQIKVLRGSENKKPAFGRNLLMEETSCTYIHFQDADDLFKPNYVEKIKQLIAKHQYDIIINNIEIHKIGNPILYSTITTEFLKANGIDFVQYCIYGAILPLMSTIRTAYLKEKGGYLGAEILPQSEDYELHARLIGQTSNYFIIDEPLAIQRLRSNSHSSSNQVQVYTSGLKALKLLRAWLPSIYHKTIAEKAASIGTILYNLGSVADAREAWIFAQTEGYKLFGNRNKIFQLLVKIIGIEKSEYLSRKFQKIKKFAGFNTYESN